MLHTSHAIPFHHLTSHTIFLFDLPAFQKDIHIIVIFLFFDFSSCCIAPETTFNTVSIVVHFF